jgi:hypothetical protein
MWNAAFKKFLSIKACTFLTIPHLNSTFGIENVTYSNFTFLSWTFDVHGIGHGLQVIQKPSDDIFLPFSLPQL